MSQQQLALDPAVEARRLRRELDRTHARLVDVESELALYIGDQAAIEAMSSQRFNNLFQCTLQRQINERIRAEALVGACWELLHEWNRLGRGDGIHGSQLRVALESQDT